MSKARLTLAALVSAVHFFASAADFEPAPWPQWRGPTRNGQVSGATWPDKLDTNHLQQTWSIELGPSYSGPIVGPDRVFTTETKDKKVEVVTAFDRRITAADG